MTEQLSTAQYVSFTKSDHVQSWNKKELDCVDHIFKVIVVRNKKQKESLKLCTDFEHTAK